MLRIWQRTLAPFLRYKAKYQKETKEKTKEVNVECECWFLSMHSKHLPMLPGCEPTLKAPQGLSSIDGDHFLISTECPHKGEIKEATEFEHINAKSTASFLYFVLKE